MDLTWHGHGCFRLKGKNASAVTDPFPPSLGIKLPRLEANVITVSHGHENHSYVDGCTKGAHVVDGLGEFEVAGIMVFGIASFHDSVGGVEKGRNAIYVIEIDDVRVCHLGDLGHKLDEETVEKIGTVDVLLVPVGARNSLGAAAAADMVRLIEPRTVIPMHYAIPGIKKELDGVETFLKEMGVTEATPVNRLSVAASASSGESEMKVVVLEPRL